MMRMKMRLLPTVAIGLGLVLALAGCNLGGNASRDNGDLSVGPASSPASPAPIVSLEEKIDLANYTAETPEAAAVIKQILQGTFAGNRVVDGGVSPETLVQRRAARLANRQAPTAEISRAPRKRPENTSTRPKITWVGKIGGPPGEAFRVNREFGYSDYYSNTLEVWSGLNLVSYSVKMTDDGNGMAKDDFGYVTALFIDNQTSSIFTVKNLPEQLPNGYSGKNTISLKTVEQDFHYIYNMKYPPFFKYTTVELTSSVPEYNYYYVPASIFEKVYGYPIRETWYWDPPWHFEKLALHIGADGVYYGATAKEGFESQWFVSRWSVADFKAAYSGAGGWHDMGWYIRDIDVEEGSVSALLYLPAAPYTEACMIYVDDSTFRTQIRIYWDNQYRSLMLDSSW